MQYSLKPEYLAALRNSQHMPSRSPRKAHGATPTWRTLRHSAAVAWLESGVHIKAMADLFAHSSIAITGDVYGRCGR
jgi:site-specific recombinase XerD